MSCSSKYEKLVEYLKTHYTYQLKLNNFDVGNNENSEASIKRNVYGQIMEFVENLETQEELKEKQKSNVIPVNFSMDGVTTLGTVPPFDPPADTAGAVAADTVSLNFNTDPNVFGTATTYPVTFGGSDTDTLNIGTPIPGGMGEDTLDFSGIAGTAWDDNKYYVDGYDPYPTLGSLKPKPNLKFKSQKYGEDKGIADLKDYVSSTYQGHYTNGNSDVQTLDLIHSVGDAESFCRSNALKYLSRYDKKGQAKRDILKAMHYCLLLYYFSGNTNDEITTRGYETF